MAFDTGIGYIQQAIQEGKERAEAIAAASGGKSLNYFQWKPGDKKIVRFLTDATITADFASFIVDKTGNTKSFLIDPADPHRLDRYRSPVPGIGWHKNFKTGVLEEPVYRKQSVGIAVLREERMGEDGKLQIVDSLFDKEVEGVTYTSRYFGLVQQSVSNFWHTLAVSCFKRYSTICDRDYEITRGEGSGFDVKYSIIPLEQDPELADPEVVKAFYFYGYDWDNNDPDRYLKCPQTVQQWAEYFSSEERFKFWLVPDNVAALQQPAQPAQQYQPPPSATYPPPPVTDQYQPMPAAAVPSGLNEFHKDTTTNDEAQAAAPVAMKPSGTNFSTLKDTLLKNAKPPQQSSS